MLTDKERREVARRLREYVDLPDDWWADTYSGFYVEKCAFGNVERHRESELFARLADLIDPDTATDTTKSPELTTKCDRDALLRLARYMDKDVAETEAHFSNVISTESVSDYARRIREALGVDDA